MILDTFLYNTADSILQILASLLAKEICLATGVKEELKELVNTLSTIKAVLLDAEEQQTKNHQLNDWIRKLKDAFTDADDILDEFEIEHTRQKLVNHRFTKKVREFLPSLHAIKFNFSMGHKLKEFNERLDRIAADKNNFQLTERLEPRPVVHRLREMTHSYMRDIDVIGRNDDKENIIHKLMYSNDHRKHVSSIFIVGIGGLGKSTLAKLVYHDEKVSEHFYLKMWVCVSMDFNLEILKRNIYTSATYGSCGELSIDQLQSKLLSTLSGRKFLLILDDVWNIDYPKWIELRSMLMDGAGRGSKIIVTTRSNSVASIMGDTYIHNLGALSRKDCFSLFVKWAFPEGEERKYPNLLEIGEKIVDKCMGVPLAARTLGSVLLNKTNESDWLQVRESELWNLTDQKQDDILPALRLSYDQLPSYLKQCFAYCSILPRGQSFCKDNLIHLWMAQNLIQSPDQNQELEDVGDQYFNDLCSRSFFQVVENGPLYVMFKMHDLLHDLALYVAQTECATMKVHRVNISRMVRHISLLGCDYLPGRDAPGNLLELEKLRTIFFPRNGIRTSTDRFVDSCISNFLLLRVLDLADSHFEVLPSSIGDLKHLRFLDLSSNHRIKKLPKSICKQLLLLQTLSFSDCKQLEELPKYIGNLINLRHLYITTKQTCFREKGIGCLTSLQSLWITGCVNLVSLPEEIGNLTALRTLAINRCQKLASLPSCMANLTKLQNLMINDCEELNLSEFIRGTRDLRIQTMVIRELPKLVALPQWLFGSCRSIHHFQIACCPNLEKLPEWLRNSASLQKLEILECPKLQELPKGFHQLNALKVLRIVKCDELIRRCHPGTGKDWKMIAHIPEVHLNKTKITYAHF